MPKRSMIRISTLCFLIVACSIGAFAAESGITFVAEHMRLTAYFGEEEVRIVISDGTEIILPQVRAASGAKYVADATTFWNKDRKSTRLNSSHVAISYAVFCLKKKNN